MNNQHFPQWHFTIGDPSIMGWLTVAAYFMAAGLSVLVSVNSARLFLSPTLGKQKTFWLMMSCAMLFLGINKQLDLQSYMTAIGKYIAMRNGWYEQRLIVQGWFIKFIVLASLSLLVFLVWYLRGTCIYNGIAIFGFCLLAAFIAIRASSFHHVDTLINSTFLNLRVNWIIELSGIMMIALSAGIIIVLNGRRKVA